MFLYKRLGKFTYHIIKPQENIKPFLLKWIGKEWKQDIEEFPDQPWGREWLELLSQMDFQLMKINLNEIILRMNLMNYHNVSYNFAEELEQRVMEMEESVLQGSSISPLLVNGRTMELMDGHTRYMILKKHSQVRCFAYVGFLR